MGMRRDRVRKLSIGAACVLASACLGATAIRVDVSTEVDCGKDAPVVIVAGRDLGELQARLEGSLITSSRSGCLAADGTVGDMVLTPATTRDGPVAFAVMTRVDGQPPERCGDPALTQVDRNQCIVAKRSLRFSPHETVDVAVRLRISCAGVVCPSDETCVQGQCVSAGCVGADCSEQALTGESDAGTSSVKLIGAGGGSTCALGPYMGTPSSLRCWGRRVVAPPLAVPNPSLAYVGGDARGFAFNGDWACVVLNDGVVKCWGTLGNIPFGVLGNGTITDSALPTAVLGIDDAVAVVQGMSHTCALLQSGGAKCWGDGQFGQLGNSKLDSPVPTPVSVLGFAGAGATQLTAGTRHTCALLTDASVHCWGENNAGELGLGYTSAASLTVPQVVPGLSAIWVSAGGYSTCAVRKDGTVACWGDNTYGQLGDGTTTDRSSPVSVLGLTGMKAVSKGDSHTCALGVDGSVWCWGFNGSGTLGDGTTINRSIPTRVVGLTASQLVTGAGHTCALTSNGQVECWGSNSYGQLGDGTTTVRLVPTPVVGL